MTVRDIAATFTRNVCGWAVPFASLVAAALLDPLLPWQNRLWDEIYTVVIPNGIFETNNQFEPDRMCAGL